VVVWDGAARHLEHSIADLAAADVVLTTNGVLRTEFGQSQRESGARGAPRRLPCMRWWRIMVDEPQYCGMGNLMEGGRAGVCRSSGPHLLLLLDRIFFFSFFF
jgi:hypothetical protein